MSVFSKILSKLGLKKPEEEAKAGSMGKTDAKPAPAAKGTQSAQPSRPARSTPIHRPAPTKAPGTPATTPMEMVDVMSKLETMAKGTNLDWKVSIVDLLKVLGIDSSLEARKELATELGASPEVMQDNVKMNVWLHKTVLAKIAQNGGNIPQQLLN
jgi:hypothetical protein